MIQAQELRVGNYLLNNGVVVTIDALSIFDIWNESKHYEPIPLTEEWLEKLGGVKNTRLSYPSYNLNGILINYIEGAWIEYVSQIAIKGVHHLQNIVYFRTNKELTKG